MEQHRERQSKPVAIHEAEDLAQSGRFSQALRRLRSGLPTVPEQFQTIGAVLLAELSERVGCPNEARQIASVLLRQPTLDVSLRARCHAVVGNILRDEGELADAETNFQRAVALGDESGDKQTSCWAKLSLVLAFAEKADPRGAVTLLTDARHHITQLGDPTATAALHLTLAQIETKRGLLTDASRHIRLAKSLAPTCANPWLDGTASIDAACLAYVSSDLETAATEAKRALESSKESGHRATERAALANLGHFELARGNYRRAEAFMRDALAMAQHGGHSEFGILDGIAQVKLARGEFDGCEEVLRRILTVGAKDSEPSYNESWSKITKARLLIARSRWKEARSTVSSVSKSVAAVSDPVLAHLLRLLKAETLLMTGHDAEAAQLIYQAASGADGVSVEVLAEIARVAGKALARSGAVAPAASQFERAAAVLASVGHLQARSEVLAAYREALWPSLAAADTGSPPPVVPRSLPRPARHIVIHADTTSRLLPLPPPGPAMAIERAAALLDLAAYPETLGHEIFALLRDTAAASEVVLSTGAPSATRLILAHAGCDYRRARALAASPRAAVRLKLGTWRERTFELHISPADTIASRMTVLAIEKLAAAAMHLEQTRREERERTALWPIESREDSGGAIFASSKMTELAATVRKVAPTTVTILLTGETGTGKDVMARLIHRASARADRPLVPFNCNAVPRDMLDSQLFGYRRGAFTGAHADFPGVIRAAAGGTLFLDEIGELSLDVQPKLLRFLESGEILPLGDSRPTTVDVRVIASTNAHLEQYVKAGRFREDLFYRLNVIRFRLPPLRERREEIPPLVEHFLERFGREYKRERLRLAEETMEYLLLYAWPGNVRELVNEMRRLAALAESAAVLMPEHLSAEITASRRTIPAAERQLGPAEIVVRTDQPLSAATEHVERTMILQALRDAGGRVDQAARVLGLSRKGLYLKRRRLHIDNAA